MGMRFQQAKGEQKYLLVLLKYLPILYVDSCKKYYMQYIYIYIYIYTYSTLDIFTMLSLGTWPSEITHDISRCTENTSWGGCGVAPTTNFTCELPFL